MSMLERIDALANRYLVGWQRWRSLLFVHWEVPVAALRPLVPPALTIDTFDGKAYVGLVPFEVAELRVLKSLPRLPGASQFLETNVRTYVSLGATPGLWFFSLDAASALAALGARAGVGLPYFRAEMQMRRMGDAIHYRSHRRFGGAAELELDYEIGAPIGPAQPGTLEHFLIERYVLYSRHPLLGLVADPIRHRPYLLRSANVVSLHETLVAAAGINVRGARTPDWYSEGVDVELLPPRPVAVRKPTPAVWPADIRVSPEGTTAAPSLH
jgi:uncharacterized protein